MEKIYSMPCLYGTCFYMKKNSACAFVDEKGKTHLVSYKEKNKIIYHNIVFLRGLEYLIFGLYYFIKNLVKIPFVYGNISVTKSISKNLNVSTKLVLTFIVGLLSVFVTFFIIGYIPAKLSVLISNYSNNAYLNRFIVGIIKIVLIYVVLLILKCITPFKQFYRFNACANLLSSKNKEIHKATNLLNYLVFGYIFSYFILSLIGFTTNAIWKPFVNILIAIFCFALSYEILYLIENSKFKWVRYICIVTSFLVIEKPSKTEEYIAQSALNEVIFMQEKKREVVDTEEFKENEVSFSAIYSESKERLKNAGIDDISEVDWLICEVMGINRGELKLLTKINLEKKKQIENAIQKRIKGEPITKIFGKTNFYGYEFKVTRDVLSPRMETEILVEQVLKITKDKMNILDIGTGSGIIAICIAKNSKANVLGIDISEKALEVAKENAKLNDVKVNFKLSNIFENLKTLKKFDIIVSNPPYIPSQDIEKLDVEVKDFDPKLALDGGEDGLKFYKKIIEQAPKYLAKNGKLCFEIGYGQRKDVCDMLKLNFENIKVIKDYNKIERVVIAQLKYNKRK